MIHRSRRWAAAGIAAAVTVALIAAAPANAEPPPDSPPATGTAVTLITGDLVTLAEAAPGRYAATVRPAPGRESITFHTAEVDGGLLVLPSDAVPYLASGVLDDRLFDVPRLIAQGYDDAQAPELPLIVRDHRPTATLTAATVATLASVDAAVVAPLKADLAGLWQELTGPGVMSGATEIWLDGRVTPVLDRSVEQIGAPAAWAAGYDGSGVDIAVLDTGIDGNHPDLAGKVTAARNFSNSPSTEDRFGHGTHVASIAAAVGPGANLLSGKVLSDSGFGFDSWIIAGMEWAVAEGAEIVNLSLGGGVTDGTDPLSEAVNRLSAEHGTLFVISAGNDGADYTVSAPGAATAALTVGAVDRDERLAEFSSRGPRAIDNAPKPEITAPGVGIVAARAAGTSMGSPVGEHHTAASGTSMAAPHVAGAAALLAQAYPDWRGTDLKDALISTAAPNPDLPVFAQGGGRVDAARAVTQAVYATGTLDFGLQRQPGERVDATVSYTNGTDAAVTLDLTVDLTNLDRDRPADGLVTGADQVTVPAESTVDVPVSLDPAQLERGRHTGAITATGPDGVVARTTVATTLAGPIHRVTFRATAADGRPGGADVLMLFGDEPRVDEYPWWVPVGGELTLELEEGTYLLQALIADNDAQFEQVSLITNPALTVTGDMEVLLDAGTATPVRIETPKPAEQQAIFSYYVHRELANGRSLSHGVMHFSTVQQLNVTPTEPVSSGEYEFSSRWQLVAPMVAASVPGLAGPFDINLLHRSPAYEGRRDFRLVWAGTGRPEELAEAGVAGKVALVEADDEWWEADQIVAAAQAGAAAVLIVRKPDNSPWTVWRPIAEREPLPAMVMGHDQGQRLIDHARDRRGGARISLTLTTSSPYLYDVMHVETGHIPDEVVHRVTTGNSARFSVGYTETGGFEWLKEQRFGWRPWQTFAWNDTQRFRRAGTTRDEWVSAGDTVWQHRVQHEYTWEDMNPLVGGMAELPRSYEPGSADAVTWFGPVVRPASPAGVPQLVSSRTGDVLSLRIAEFADSGAGHFELLDRAASVRLLRDGEVIAELPDARRDVPTVPEPAAYRLELTTERESPEWQWSTRTETAWEFGSAHTDQTTPLPLAQVDYRVPADLTGQVPGGLPHLIGITLRGADGRSDISLEISFDAGEDWRPVRSWQVGDRLVALVPPGEGTVSLRVHAEDSAGNTVTQTVIDAYGLR
jgi:subtilisin family serine protease